MENKEMKYRSMTLREFDKWYEALKGNGEWQNES